VNLEQILLIGGMVVSGVGAAIALAKVRSERRKMTSEAKKIDVDTIAVISSSAIALLAPMETKVKNLSAELAATTDQLAKVTARAQESSAALAATTAELVSTKEELVETKTQLDAAVGRIADLEATVTDLVNRLRHYETDRDGLEHEGGT
jgi:chromosome segregation ATPase